jgi:MoaA/NifB/PqqE/SkfB family radical SAM enzyme
MTIILAKENLNDTLSEYHRRYLRERGKAAILSYPPRWMTIGITGACYFRCKYCVHHCPDVKNDPELENKFYKIPFHIKIEEFKNLVDFAYAGRIPRVHICATGEPFLHAEIFDMIDYVIEKYGDVSTQTDFGKQILGQTKLDEIVARAKNITYITTDIISHNKKVHEGIKVGSDFDYLLDSLEYLSRKGGVLINVSHVLNKDYSRDIVKIPMLLRSRHIKFMLNIPNIYPYGINDVTQFNNLYFPEDANIKKELDDVREYCRDANIPCSIPEPYGHSKCLAFWDKIQTMPLKTTSDNNPYWYAETACNFCNAFVRGGINTLGNIMQYENIMDFWNNPILVNIRSQLALNQFPELACAQCACYSQPK